jgi:hypothetical protein
MSRQLAFVIPLLVGLTVISSSQATAPASRSKPIDLIKKFARCRSLFSITESRRRNSCSSGKGRKARKYFLMESSRTSLLTPIRKSNWKGMRNFAVSQVARGGVAVAPEKYGKA